MNAKDKEKLKLAGTIVSFMKGDPIVIDPNEMGKKEKIDPADDDSDLTDAEKLSCDIIMYLAQKTAEGFEDMADGMETSTLKKIVSRIETADVEDVVGMLQTMFLARGMVEAAEQLDLLALCAEYDGDAYYLFYDSLFDTDIFDWFSIEIMFDDFHNDSEQNETD